MSHNPHLIRRRLVALAFALAAPLAAQTQPPSPPDVNASPGAPAPSVHADQIIALNPFEVSEDSDKSYGALNSNSIARFNTELNKMPISADIFDQSFMNDIGTAGGVESMIEQYSPGAGFSQSDPASSAANGQPGDRNGNSYIQVRGLATPTMQRDGFMINGTFLNPGSNGVGFSSTFDIERVEIIQGPQAMLYGAGGGGGVINTVSKQARLGHPAFGSVQFQVDQYGNKLGLLDVGAGNDTVALRFSMQQQNVSSRRQNIGGPFEGYYGQVAFKLFHNTTVRVTSENTTWDRINSQSLSLTAASTSNDARNGQNLHYLLASNQITAAAGGKASGAGAIDNGLVNWGNVDSFAGWQGREITINRYSTITFDTVWNSWLSSELALGYDDYFDDRVSNTLTFYAPNNTANPLAGQWAIGETGSAPMSDTNEPSRTKGIRASLLATNDLFHGLAHSQTNFGTDFIRGDQDQITYEYFTADSNWNPTSTIVPKVYWSVDNGPVKYPLWEVSGQKRVTYNGVNYVQAIQNPPQANLISPSNPQGVNPSGAHYIQQKVINKGIFGVNDTQWMDGKLDTLLGFRYEFAEEATYQEGALPYLDARKRAFNFSAGANYAILPWLRPYVSISDSIDPPLVQSTDPYGAQPVTARALGEEAGFKVQNAAGTVSGSLAAYHTSSKNEEYLITSTLVNDINPTGLNGRPANAGNWINVPRTAEGVQLMMIASPTPNWRLRFGAAYTDGRIGATTSYNQYYNDQFHENSQGQVTYADGTVVYVPPTFNSKAQLAYTQATAPAGSVPLTVAAMSDSTNTYFANPIAITGQINSGSNAAKVLQYVDPAHGAILTGATGLPISAIQINPGFTPPGTIITSKDGDVTTGYAQYSAVLTSVYTFDSGWEKGIRVGGTAQMGWKVRQFYYYPTGITPGAPRTLFYWPNINNYNLILGYSHKFSRVTWSTQLNVNNLFNHYHIVIIPSPTAGWTGVLNATFDQQPRNYVWSNTISF